MAVWGGFSPLSDGWSKAGKMLFLSNELDSEEETTPLGGWRRELAGGGGKRGFLFIFFLKFTQSLVFCRR